MATASRLTTDRLISVLPEAFVVVASAGTVVVLAAGFDTVVFVAATVVVLIGIFAAVDATVESFWPLMTAISNATKRQICITLEDIVATEFQ